MDIQTHPVCSFGSPPMKSSNHGVKRSHDQHPSYTCVRITSVFGDANMAGNVPTQHPHQGASGYLKDYPTEQKVVRNHG